MCSEQGSPSLTCPLANQGRSAGSAQFPLDRALQASSGDTAQCTSHQKCLEGMAACTESRSSQACRTHSCP